LFVQVTWLQNGVYDHVTITWPWQSFSWQMWLVLVSVRLVTSLEVEGRVERSPGSHEAPVTTTDQHRTSPGNTTRTGVNVVIHVEMPKAAPKKSICRFQKLEMILKISISFQKWNKQITVRLPQKYQNSKITFVGAWSLIRLNVKGMLLWNFEFCMPAWNLLFWLINGWLTINVQFYY